MRRRPLSLATWLLALLLAACATPSVGPSATASDDAPMAVSVTGEVELIVFAAASLADAFKALAPAFEAAHPGAKIIFNFAGAQQLAAQINAGAPADVFASANTRQMATVVAGAKVVGGSERLFVYNRLVVVVPKDNPAGLGEVQDLAASGVKLILADPSVPVGQYSLDVLAKASALPAYTQAFSPTVLANVVSYEDNVRAVLSKIALGEGDAGIVYTTDAASQAAQLGQIAIPDELNVIAAYPIAPLAASAHPELAGAFVDYVLSPAGQQLLAEYGFIPATAN